MQYMLLIHTDDTPFMTASEEQRTEMAAPYAAYNEALIKAGAMVAGERLRPATMSRSNPTRCRAQPAAAGSISSPSSIT